MSTCEECPPESGADSCTHETDGDPKNEDAPDGNISEGRRRLRERLRELDGRVGPGYRPTGRAPAPSETVAERRRKERRRRRRGEPPYSGDSSSQIDELLDEHFFSVRMDRLESAEVLRQRRGDFSWADVDIQAFLAGQHERKEDKWGTDYRIGLGEPSGKTPDSSEFLRETQGDIPDHLHVDTDRFLALPRRVVEDLVGVTAGGLTWGDTVRMEIPVVSYLAGLTAEQPPGPRTIEYDHGAIARVPDGQIVVSMQKVARALFERFYYCPTHRDDMDSDPSFSAFYKRITRTFGRLTDTSLLGHHGPALDTGNKTSDAFGQRYSVHVPDLHALPYGSRTPAMTTSGDLPTAPAGSYVDTFALRLGDGREVVDVAGLFDELAREYTGQWETFTEQAAKSTTASENPANNFRGRERGVEGFGWQRRQARPSTVDREDGKENSRHVTTGAYKPGRATCEERSHLPCTVPFIILEIDGETPQLCLEYARRILRWLKGMDVPMGSVTVTYTGNESFHIRLPAGLFGNPIFRSTREATRTIRELYDLVEGEINQLEGAHLDGALASPLHHIRAIGSVHEGLYSEEDKVRYCVGFTGEEILRYPLNAIREFSERYDAYTLPRPGKAPFHARLHRLLRDAQSRSQAACKRGDGDGSRGIVDLIRREGVEKGEEFAPGCVGRNLAARLLSLRLLQSGKSTQDAWLSLQNWNEKNGPPLGQAPGDYDRELRYVFENAVEDAPYL